MTESYLFWAGQKTKHQQGLCFLIENTYIKLRKQRRHGPALKFPFWKCIGFDIWYLLTEHLHTNWFFHYISCSSAPSRLPNILLSLPMTFNFPPQTLPWSMRCCLSGEGGGILQPCILATHSGVLFLLSVPRAHDTLSHLLPARSFSLCLVPLYVSFRPWMLRQVLTEKFSFGSF